LGAIFLLKQAPYDLVTPLSAARALGRLAQSTEEASMYMTASLKPDEARALRLRRFEALSALAKDVPMYTLELSLTGAFWQAIEEALGWPA
jgi:hypothetical protein